jgi:hypothetical protein
MRLARRGSIVTLRDRMLARFRLHPGAKSVAGLTAAIREDLRARRRAGLPPWSDAARYLAYHGYWRPIRAAVGERVRGLGRRRGT